MFHIFYVKLKKFYQQKIKENARKRKIFHCKILIKYYYFIAKKLLWESSNLEKNEECKNALQQKFKIK